jgi:hypothetical protein
LGGKPSRFSANAALTRSYAHGKAAEGEAKIQAGWKAQKMGRFGKPWIEVGITQASVSGMVRPSLATPVWPTCWQGWLLCAALPLSEALSFWLILHFRWMPSNFLMACLFGVPGVTWLIVFAAKARIIDER